jgi:hypothetical protein
VELVFQSNTFGDVWCFSSGLLLGQILELHPADLLYSQLKPAKPAGNGFPKQGSTSSSQPMVKTEGFCHLRPLKNPGHVIFGLAGLASATVDGG